MGCLGLSDVKLGRSLGIEVVKDVWLKILERLKNSISFLFKKSTFRMLLGCLRTDLFGSCFYSFDSMMSRGKRYHCLKWMDLVSFVNLSLSRTATFWRLYFFSKGVDVIQKLFYLYLADH